MEENRQKHKTALETHELHPAFSQGDMGKRSAYIPVGHSFAIRHVLPDDEGNPSVLMVETRAAFHTVDSPLEYPCANNEEFLYHCQNLKRNLFGIGDKLPLWHFFTPNARSGPYDPKQPNRGSFSIGVRIENVSRGRGHAVAHDLPPHAQMRRNEVLKSADYISNILLIQNSCHTSMGNGLFISIPTNQQQHHFWSRRSFLQYSD